ncbi:MAG TPA: DUF3108 domain-containing protein [Acetobacteraceae bacterium]|nr:DUF3108 domain-containing protein [Acetobacteraceae bacterium]
MRRAAPRLLGLLLLLPMPAAAARESPALHASYAIYAAGFRVARVQVVLGVEPRSYQLQVAYHTVGLVGFFHHGHQRNSVVGTWDADQPEPRRYEGAGVWGGDVNMTLIDYLHGQPLVQRLIPRQAEEREPVPMALRQNSVDSLSALALLIRRVEDTNRCEASVHTFDGYRASEITTRTVGERVLAPTGRSIFSGKALRCDFLSQELAGFRRRDNTPYDRRPLHGSAWLARVIPGAPPVPVRMDFETLWFGDATMYLTQLGQAPPTEVAAH